MVVVVDSGKTQFTSTTTVTDTTTMAFTSAFAPSTVERRRSTYFTTTPAQSTVATSSLPISSEVWSTDVRGPLPTTERRGPSTSSHPMAPMSTTTRATTRATTTAAAATTAVDQTTNEETSTSRMFVRESANTFLTSKIGDLNTPF